MINLENLSKLLELLQNVCGSIKCARELIALIIKQIVAITYNESKIPINISNIFYMVMSVIEMGRLHLRAVVPS